MTQVLIAPNRWRNTGAYILIQCAVNHRPEGQLDLKKTSIAVIKSHSPPNPPPPPPPSVTPT